MSVFEEVGVSKAKVFFGGIIVATLLAGSIFASSVVEDVPAGKLFVRQAFYTGDLEIWADPGVHWQNFGTLTDYDRSDQFWFSSRRDQGGGKDDSLPIQFNDGGTARISGSIRFDLPTGNKLLELHKKYRSMEAVKRDLIYPVVQKAVQLSGPMMSSKESAAIKRTALLSIIEDQANNGIYRTMQQTTQVEDPSNPGKMKNVTTLVPVSDPKAPNGIGRAEESPLTEFGIRIYALSVNEIKYDDKVQAQITRQQEIDMEVQTAMAAARRAEQEALTVKAQGEAMAAKAKWEQEQVKAKAVTKAQQEKEVAELDAQQKLNVAQLDKQTAEQEKAAKILRAEGEATSRTKLMQADGALEQKLEAYKKVNEVWAEAFSSRKTPQIVMGGGEGDKHSNDAENMMRIIGLKAARDLSLDLSTANK